jgi:hypothetical protein
VGRRVRADVVYAVRDSLTTLTASLDLRRFVRIHRGALVNPERVREIVSTEHGDYRVRMQDGTELRLSRRHRYDIAGPRPAAVRRRQPAARRVPEDDVRVDVDVGEVRRHEPAARREDPARRARRASPLCWCCGRPRWSRHDARTRCAQPGWRVGDRQTERDRWGGTRTRLVRATPPRAVPASGLQDTRPALCSVRATKTIR